MSMSQTATRDLEANLAQLLATASTGLRPESVANLHELVAHGEYGVALENLCEELYEWDIAVPADSLRQIVALGSGMGIDPSYWEGIQTTDGP